MLESKFQRDLILDLEEMFPGCLILKGNSAFRQGIPDWLIIWRDRWAMLECKRSARATKQPNQDYYVDMFNEMSFAAFIYPENKEEVLSALQSAFGVGGTTRVSQRKQRRVARV